MASSDYGTLPKGKNFDASGTFDCTETVFPSSTQGKLKSSKKLTAQYWDYTGVSCQYVCTKLSTPQCP